MPDFNDIISRNVVESLPVGLLIVDHTGAFVTVNPAAAAILGYPRDQLLGRGWGELFFENDANRLFNQVILDVIQKELVGLCREVPYAAPTGGLLHLSITSSYLRGETSAAGVVVILHDLTELSRMQRRETDILKEINRIQEEKIRGLNKLAASVAHQIRNPAFAIGGFASRLGRQIASHGITSDYPGIILAEARRLETIVSTVGRFAALGPLRLVSTTLAAIVEAARLRAASLAQPLSRTLVWAGETPETPIVADARLLTVALEELFHNSLQYSRRETVAIHIAAETTPEHVTLVVTDDGPGVAPADAPHIFDPFYSSRPDGAGMGLTLAQEILLEHNGRIELDRNHRAGARFRLFFPRFPRHLVSRLDDSPRP